MADNFGVLGSSTVIAIGTTTVYTCPANKAAKIKIMGYWQAGANSGINIVVNNIIVATQITITGAFWVFTNGGAGFWRAAAATVAGGTTAAETVQPCAPIYYLSAGQTVQYIVSTANLAVANCQVVGIEVDLSP